jgi:hypothetical protein
VRHSGLKVFVADPALNERKRKDDMVAVNLKVVKNYLFCHEGFQRV